MCLQRYEKNFNTQFFAIHFFPLFLNNMTLFLNNMPLLCNNMTLFIITFGETKITFGVMKNTAVSYQMKKVTALLDSSLSHKSV